MQAIHDFLFSSLSSAILHFITLIPFAKNGKRSHSSQLKKSWTKILKLFHSNIISLSHLCFPISLSLSLSLFLFSSSLWSLSPYSFAWRSQRRVGVNSGRRSTWQVLASAGQCSNRRNQREHVVFLLANSQSRFSTPSSNSTPKVYFYFKRVSFYFLDSLKIIL